MGGIIDPSHIRYASRVSQDRFQLSRKHQALFNYNIYKKILKNSFYATIPEGHWQRVILYILIWFFYCNNLNIFSSPSSNISFLVPVTFSYPLITSYSGYSSIMCLSDWRVLLHLCHVGASKLLRRYPWVKTQ